MIVYHDGQLPYRILVRVNAAYQLCYEDNPPTIDWRVLLEQVFKRTDIQVASNHQILCQ